MAQSSRNDLNDVTFIIPVYIDSPVRLQNLQYNLRHLTSLFETRILIGEQKRAEAPPVADALPGSADRIDYLCFEPGSPDNPFCHTKIINRLLSRVETPFTCNLDCDFVGSVQQYLTSVQLLRWQVAEFVVPYNDRAVHIPDESKKAVLEKLLTRPLAKEEIEKFVEFVWRGYSVGGALFARTEIYRQSGGENENFIGWGWEDHERVVRFEKLGHRVRRVPGDFYHLSHPRGLTSSANHPHYETNCRELERITDLPPDSLSLETIEWARQNFFTNIRSSNL
jgi:hypothetical protein